MDSLNEYGAMSNEKASATNEYEVLPNGKTSAIPITYIPQDGRDDVVKCMPTTVHASDLEHALQYLRNYLRKEPVDSTAEEIEP